MNYFKYGIILIIGAFFGWILIDAEHALWARFYFHNMYFVSFLIGAMTALILKAIITSNPEVG